MFARRNRGEQGSHGAASGGAVAGGGTVDGEGTRRIRVRFVGQVQGVPGRGL